MPLSEDEQRILHEIERRFYEHDPEYAKSIESTTLYRSLGRNCKWAALGFIAGLVVLLVSFASSVLLGAFGFGVMLVSAIVFTQNLRKMGRGRLAADDRADALAQHERCSATPAAASASVQAQGLITATTVPTASRRPAWSEPADGESRMDGEPAGLPPGGRGPQGVRPRPSPSRLIRPRRSTAGQLNSALVAAAASSTSDWAAPRSKPRAMRRSAAAGRPRPTRSSHAGRRRLRVALELRTGRRRQSLIQLAAAATKAEFGGQLSRAESEPAVAGAASDRALARGLGHHLAARPARPRPETRRRPDVSRAVLTHSPDHRVMRTRQRRPGWAFSLRPQSPRQPIPGRNVRLRA